VRVEDDRGDGAFDLPGLEAPAPGRRLDLGELVEFNVTDVAVGVVNDDLPGGAGEMLTSVLYGFALGGKGLGVAGADPTQNPAFLGGHYMVGVGQHNLIVALAVGAHGFPVKANRFGCAGGSFFEGADGYENGGEFRHVGGVAFDDERVFTSHSWAPNTSLAQNRPGDAERATLS